MVKARYRKKAQFCCLCHNEETRDWNYVCNTCRKHRRDGALLEKQKEAAEGARDHVSVRWHPNLMAHSEDKPFEWEEAPGDILVDLLRTLGQSPKYPRGTRLYSKQPLGHRHGDSGEGRHYLFLTPDQASALEGVIFFSRRLWATAYKKGYDQGSSILVRMAAGDIKPADFSEHEEKRAKSVKGGIDND